MKKFYLAVVCMLGCTVMVYAQNDRYWVGTNGNWNNTANWALTSGGTPGASVPSGTTINVFFDKSAIVTVDIPSFSLNRLTVTASSTVKLVRGGSDLALTLVSSATGTPALQIDNGSTLVDSVNTANVLFNMVFAPAAKGTIAGTWQFAGVAGPGTPVDDGFAYCSFPGAAGQGNVVQVTGTIIIKNYAGAPDAPVGSGYLVFNSGATYLLDCDGGATPSATWNATSTARVTGVIDNPPSIFYTTVGVAQLGNLVYDCAGMTDDAGWNWPLGFTLTGDLSITNTNNKLLSLAIDNGAAISYTLGGNAGISGNSNVAFVNSDGDFDYTLQVNGNFNLSGGSFSLREATAGALTATTALKVKGNINHTAGTFTSNNTTTSTSSDLFVVEMNGTAAQTIISTGMDNAAHQVTLRLNNTAGVTLQSPVAVGKISWNSANKGNLITTAANPLTINNTDASDVTVVNGVSNAGFVSGTVQRATASTATYRFPTGKSGAYRYAEVIPASATPSVYASEYFGSAFSNLTTNGTLTGVSNVQYWYVNRVSGDDAAVQLTLQDGVVPGATSTDVITVGRYSATSHWSNANLGTGTFLPYNSTTGSVRSAVLNNFLTGNFTFGYGLNATLPIDLVSFNAKKQSASAAQLTWGVSESSTPAKFGVLRSADGNTFTSIGTVTAAEQKLNYDFTDNTLPAGTVYYRLQLYDKDGSYKLSKIVAVVNGVNGVLVTAMMPTLVVDRARLNVSSAERGTMQLVVTDIQGKIVYQQLAGITNGNQEIWMNLSTLSAGNYQVTGYMNNERTATFRFIKQ